MSSPNKLPYGSAIPSSVEFPSGLPEHPRPYGDKITPDKHVIKLGTRDYHRGLPPGDPNAGASSWDPEAATAWAAGTLPPQLQDLVNQVDARKMEKTRQQAIAVLQLRYVGFQFGIVSHVGFNTCYLSSCSHIILKSFYIPSMRRAPMVRQPHFTPTTGTGGSGTGGSNTGPTQPAVPRLGDTPALGIAPQRPRATEPGGVFDPLRLMQVNSIQCW